jgi:hypothetical protein
MAAQFRRVEEGNGRRRRCEVAAWGDASIGTGLELPAFKLSSYGTARPDVSCPLTLIVPRLVASPFLIMSIQHGNLRDIIDCGRVERDFGLKHALSSRVSNLVV